MKKKLKIFLMVCLLLIVLLCIYTLLAKTGLFFKNDNSKDIVISVNVTAPGQTLKINKYFKNDYIVDRGDGSPVQKKWVKEIDGDWGDREYWTHNYKKRGNYTVRLSLSHGVYRWKFDCNSSSLIPKYGTTVSDVKIVLMPSLADGFGDNATNPGDCFFSYFNSEGVITSLPEGSFDTSHVTKAGNCFFCRFNQHSVATRYMGLKDLPVGSFDLSNITIAGDSFFDEFNGNGGITKLPEGSFNMKNIKKAGNRFFSYFNSNGALISLPEGSFDISNIANAGNYFFDGFNYNGALISLPEGSFNLSNITEAGTHFFCDFNYNGAIANLPKGSFNISNITKVGDYFFAKFNERGKMTSLSEGSFDTSKISGVGSCFFCSFNYFGKLMSLPDGSFDISNITEAGDYFFSHYNSEGEISELPIGSFNVSNIVKTGKNYFASFNLDGKIKQIPDGTPSGVPLVSDIQKRRNEICVDNIKKYLGQDSVEVFSGLTNYQQTRCEKEPFITGEYYIKIIGCSVDFGIPQVCLRLCYQNGGNVIIDRSASCEYDSGGNELIKFYWDYETGLLKEIGDEKFLTTEGRISLCNQCVGLSGGKTLDWFEERLLPKSYLYYAGQETYNRKSCQIYYDGGKITIGNVVCFSGVDKKLDSSVKISGLTGSLGVNTNEGRDKICVEKIKEYVNKGFLKSTGNILEVVYLSSNPPRGNEILMFTGYSYLVRDYGRMGWALYYKDAGIIVKNEDMICEYDSDGNLTKLNYNPDRIDLLKNLGDDRYLTTEGRLSLCNAKTSKNRTMEILKPDYYTYVEIESRGITSGSWKTECRIHFDDGKVEIIDHMAEMNKMVMSID